MKLQFRPAVRSDDPLIIGISGASGSGKTFSALRLATGLAGKDRFAVIDTESGRARHYAGLFNFDHGDLRPPFSPDAYKAAIQSAVEAGYKVVVIDSMSHEHAGEGGLLDWHDTELDRMAGDDYRKRESCNMAAWIKPKVAHKAFVQYLLQAHVHLILCFRAEEKIEMVKDDKGKLQIMPKRSLSGFSGWTPICEKSLPYELTASFLMLPDHPGVPVPIKLQEQHRAFFPADQIVTEQSGRALAQWAAGTPALENCASLEELSKVWNGLSVDQKAALEKVKDERKAALTRAQMVEANRADSRSFVGIADEFDKAQSLELDKQLAEEKK